MPKRAERRHALERMKAKAQRIGKDLGMPGRFAKRYDHLASCSGPCCGNPRRWWKTKDALTMPERRVCEALRVDKPGSL